MSEELCDLGVIGLTTLGQSLAAHHASNKVRVVVGDEDPSFVPQVIKEYRAHTASQGDGDGEAGGGGAEGAASSGRKASRCMVPSSNVEEMVARLKRPRKIIVFGTNGEDAKFVDLWSKMSSILEKDDAVLRWGREEDAENDGSEPPPPSARQNSVTYYNDSIVGSLSKLQARPRGVHLLEMVRLERDRVVAFEGSNLECYLAGGPREGYAMLEPYLTDLANVGHAGDDAGCAHYAHMIQRTIESGTGQVFAEAYDILNRAAGYENQEVGRTFGKWHDAGGRMSSYQLRISSRILYKRDNLTKDGHVVDHIVDSLDPEPSDTWTTLEATKLSVPVPTINAAVESRTLSSMKDDRVDASSVLGAPDLADTPSVLKDQISEDLQNAMYCACLCLVAEGLSVLIAASDVENWNANAAECLRLWNNPGSFLESTFLSAILSALADWTDTEEVGKTILLVPGIASELQELHMSWRRVVSLSFASAIPCPTLSSSLTHYDTLRSRTLPISVFRAQRDYFDGSGYDRFSERGWHTTCWVKEHTLERKKREAALAKAGLAPEEPPVVDAEEQPPKKKKKKKRTSKEGHEV